MVHWDKSRRVTFTSINQINWVTRLQQAASSLSIPYLYLLSLSLAAYRGLVPLIRYHTCTTTPGKLIAIGCTKVVQLMASTSFNIMPSPHISITGRPGCVPQIMFILVMLSFSKSHQIVIIYLSQFAGRQILYST